MLPAAYEGPVAVALVLGGALACFAGYRLFRIVLGIYGFLLGAMIASSIAGTGSTAGMVGAAIAGGLAGAVVLVLAWFVGVALVGAGLGALLAHLVWNQLYAGDPPALAVILVSVAGALDRDDPPALRDHRRHGVRGRVDGGRRRRGADGQPGGGGRRGRRRGVGDVSAFARAGAAVGAGGVGGGRDSRHRGADADYGEEAMVNRKLQNANC